MNRRQFLTGLAGLVGVSAPAEAREAELTQAQMIDILADYNLIHKPRLMDGNGMGLHGRTNAFDKTIEIADQDRAFKRRTIIHEMYHVVFNLDNREQSDKEIDRLTEKLYEKLYGEK